jgi:multidrug efflux pump subunit AcrA (membrane-fusion protein)
MANRSTRVKVLNGVLAAVLVGGVALIVTTVGNSSSASATPRTVLASRGTVSTSVTATGNVQTPQSIPVSFKNGGTVTEIDVTQGQQVSTGQVLAKVDPTDAQNTLTAAQANLTAAQAKLAQLEQVLTPAEVAQNNATLAQSQQQLNAAQVSLADTQKEVAADATNLQAAVTQANATLAADQAQLAADQANPANQAKVSADQATVAKDQAAVSSAASAQTMGQLKDQASVDQAQNSVISAQDGLTAAQAANAVKAQPPQAGDVASQQAAIAQAQAQVNSDQEAVTNCTLVAPADGVVATISGQVGEAASGGGSSSSSSSSSSSGGSGSGASGGSSSGSSGTAGSSSGGFITLTNLQNLQVVAGFTEVDAAKIQVNQPAVVTVSALPGQNLAGTVGAIDTLQTVVSNVVTYNVTVNLNTTVAGLKPGMTANVVVTTGQKSNVIRVPNAAVTTRGATSTVRVLAPDNKQQVVAVTVGLRGDSFTEIQSGLTTTSRVVISNGAVAATTGTGTGTGRAGAGGFGGFGGGGLGGGLGGGGARAGG